MTSTTISVRPVANGAIYTTQDGDVLDQIAWRYYGSEAKTTDALLDANPGLAAKGSVLPLGIDIFLPDSLRPSPTANELPKVRLFD